MKATLKLIRVDNILISIFSLFFVVWITPNPQLNTPFFVGILTVFSVMAAANVLNDIVDIKTDASSHKNRVLALKKVSMQEARLIAFGFQTVAVLSAFLLPDGARATALLTIMMLFLYNLQLKWVPFFGNFTVAFAGFLLFLFASQLIQGENEFIIPAMLAFLIHFIREIVKDLEDRNADAAMNATTAAHVVPTVTIHNLLIALITVLIFFVLTLIWYDVYNIYFTIVSTLTVLPLLFYFIRRLWRSKSETEVYKALSLQLKLVMFFGLIALGLGSYQ
jgi:4-hydroxybenzoate polyprenyltransferase